MKVNLKDIYEECKQIKNIGSGDCKDCPFCNFISLEFIKDTSEFWNDFCFGNSLDQAPHKFKTFKEYKQALVKYKLEQL